MRDPRWRGPIRTVGGTELLEGREPWLVRSRLAADIRRSRAFYSFEICVLPFRDPDNVQLELTSPL